MDGFEVSSTVEWSPHPLAAPKTRMEAGRLTLEPNGTGSLCGGFQLRVEGTKPGESYRIEVPVSIEGVENPDECVKCLAIWDEIPAGTSDFGAKANYDYLLLEEGFFRRTLTAPRDAKALILRYTLRWASAGRAVFGLPRIVKAATPAKRSVRISIATGSIERRRKAAISSIEGNAAYYTRLCEEACEAKPDIVVLPETALQWGVQKHYYEKALTLDSPHLDPFKALARKKGAQILVPMHERDGDAVFNSAVLLGPEGVGGVYRKVHLAEYSEVNSGLRAGEGFPVFQTPAGRVGCLICMDSSNAEASRMLGLNGAEIMLLPIMGDHRADRFTRGTPVFHEERWKAIMRTRSLDNQFITAVARNEAQGSCVIDAKGEILAWNDGTEDIVSAEVELDPDHRKWNGGSQRDIVWLQRRPRLYGAFVEPRPPEISFL